MSNFRLTDIEIEELAGHISGIDIDHVDDYEDRLDDWLIENYELDLAAFKRLMEKVFPLFHFAVAEISGGFFKGLANKEEGTFLIQRPVETSYFIGAMIAFLRNSPDVTAHENGDKELRVLSAGKPAYVVHLKKWED